MSSRVMTLLGAVGAALAFLQAGLPNATPAWVKLGLGATSAFLAYYLGQTNKGTTAQPAQRIDVTVTESAKQPFQPKV